MSNSQQLRSHIEHIVASEKTYYDSILILDTAYRDALRAGAGPQFAESVLQGLTPIVKTSETFYKELLAEHTRKVADESERNFGQVFSKLHRFFLVYRTYLSVYSNVDKILSREMRRNAKLVRVLAEVAGNTGSDINSCRICPVQRMPRYSLLLRDLVKYHRREHPGAYLDLVEGAPFRPEVVANASALAKEGVTDVVGLTPVAQDLLLAMAQLSRVTDELNTAITDQERQAAVVNLVTHRIRECPPGAPDGALEQPVFDQATMNVLTAYENGAKLDRGSEKLLKLAQKQMMDCARVRWENQQKIDQAHRTLIAEVGPVGIPIADGKTVSQQYRWLIILNDIIVICTGRGPSPDFFYPKANTERDGSTDIEPLVYRRQLRLDTARLAMLDLWLTGGVANTAYLRNHSPWRVDGRAPSSYLSSPELRDAATRSVVFQSEDASVLMTFESRGTAFEFIKLVRQLASTLRTGLPIDRQLEITRAPLATPVIPPVMVPVCQICGLLQEQPHKNSQCERCGRVCCTAVKAPKERSAVPMFCSCYLKEEGQRIILCKHCFANDEHANTENTAFLYISQEITKLESVVSRRNTLLSDDRDREFISDGSCTSTRSRHSRRRDMSDEPEEERRHRSSRKHRSHRLEPCDEVEEVEERPARRHRKHREQEQDYVEPEAVQKTHRSHRSRSPAVEVHCPSSSSSTPPPPPPADFSDSDY